MGQRPCVKHGLALSVTVVTMPCISFCPGLPLSVIMLLSCVCSPVQGAARNRMLVKGGSSFNALVRAMKQDLVEGGLGAQAAQRDPNVRFQVRTGLLKISYCLLVWGHGRVRVTNLLHRAGPLST